MEWIKLDLARIRSEQFVDSDPTQRATWLCLLAYCADQENGGVIKGCLGWKDRKWIGLACVTKEEVATESPLWEWRGDDLIVWGYPTKEEKVLQRKRAGGKSGGQKSRKQANKDADKHPFKDQDKDSLKDSRKDRDNRVEESREDKSRAEVAEPPPPPRTFSDLVIECPNIHVTRDERSDWEAAYRKYGHSRMVEMYQDLAQDGKVFKSKALLWLSGESEINGHSPSNDLPGKRL